MIDNSIYYKIDSSDELQEVIEQEVLKNNSAIINFNLRFSHSFCYNRFEIVRDSKKYLFSYNDFYEQIINIGDSFSEFKMYQAWFDSLNLIEMQDNSVYNSLCNSLFMLSNNIDGLISTLNTTIKKTR